VQNGALAAGAGGTIAATTAASATTATSATTAAGLTGGSPLTQAAFIPANTTVGPQQYFFDDFYTAANVTVGAIGSPTGNSCGISATNANVNHPGQIGVTSGTVSGAGEACFVGVSGDGDFSMNTAPSWLKESNVLVPVLPGTTAAAYQFGSSSGVLMNPWVNGFAFYLSSANAVPNDWYCEKGSTLTDSTVTALAATWTRLTLVSDGTNLHYYINGTQVCGTGTPISTINANSMPAGAWSVTALSTTSVTMAVDYLTSTRAAIR
jgi:hypothetical protein